MLKKPFKNTSHTGVYLAMLSNHLFLFVLLYLENFFVFLLLSLMYFYSKFQLYTILHFLEISHNIYHIILTKNISINSQKHNLLKSFFEKVDF